MINKKDFETSIKNNLFELFAKDFAHAREPEIYTALANSIRQIVGEKWFHSLYDNLEEKRLYILSFEYTLGDNMLKNLIKLNIYDLAKEILEEQGIDIDTILAWDIEFALGFGDLGAVSGYMLEHLASHHNNVYAYGLRFRNGMLKQEIIEGKQVEKADSWRVSNNPWEHEKGFNHKVDFVEDSLKAIPYDIPLMSNDSKRVSTLRLWKSFSMTDLDFEDFSAGKIQKSYEAINRANSIVEFLYPSEDNKEGKKLRLEQEYFFASASIQDILKKYKKYIGKDIDFIDQYVNIQVNDVHPALSVLVFIDLVMKKYDKTFAQALDLAKKVFIYMQLSILPESIEAWNLSLLSEVNPHLVELIYELDKAFKMDLVKHEVQDIERLMIINQGKVNLNNILYYTARKIVYVVGDHKKYLEKSPLSTQFAYYQDKFQYVGLDFDSNQYYKERKVKGMPSDDNWKSVQASDLCELKTYNKDKLLQSLNLDPRLINTKSIFVMHLGNFHEYKRQFLSALSIALQYMRLKKNPNLDIPERTYFFAGKSYPNYFAAKESIRFINALAKLINNDLFIKDKIKIVFIENYDLAKANLAIPASDIFLNLEKLTLESNRISLNKAFLSAASVVTSKSNYENSSLKEIGVKAYEFGDSVDEILSDYGYNMHGFVADNLEISELFDFLRGQRRDQFPYEIDEVYKLIFYYNDSNRVLKDLLAFTDTLETTISELTHNPKWYDQAFENAIKIINAEKYIGDFIKIVE